MSKSTAAFQERNNAREKPENSLLFILICVDRRDLSKLEDDKERVEVLMSHLLGIFGKDVSWEGLWNSLCISRVWMSSCTSLAHFCVVSKTHMMQKRFTKR